MLWMPNKSTNKGRWRTSKSKVTPVLDPLRFSHYFFFLHLFFSLHDHFSLLLTTLVSLPQFPLNKWTKTLHTACPTTHPCNPIPRCNTVQHPVVRSHFFPNSPRPSDNRFHFFS